MQTITAIEPQKKNPRRVNIHLDGEFAFGLSRTAAGWLQVGQHLSEEKIAALQREDSREGAMQQALLLLAYRPRSVAEVRRNLIRHDYAPEVVDATLERLTADGLLGDDEFARAWIENRNTFRPRGKRVLRLELRQKGISDEAIGRALAGTADEQALALAAGRRYARRLDGLDWPEFRTKLAAHLGRRGFSYEVASWATSQIWQEAPGHTGAETDDHEDIP